MEWPEHFEKWSILKNINKVDEKIKATERTTRRWVCRTNWHEGTVITMVALIHFFFASLKLYCCVRQASGLKTCFYLGNLVGCPNKLKTSSELPPPVTGMNVFFLLPCSTLLLYTITLFGLPRHLSKLVASFLWIPVTGRIDNLGKVRPKSSH